MVDTGERFRDDTQGFGGLEQMSLEEAQSRKEALQAERNRAPGSATASERVSSRAQEAQDSLTRGMNLIDKIKHYSLEIMGRGPQWQYQQLVKEMSATVADARIVSANAQTLLKEYTSQQKELQHNLRIDRQLLSCNLAEISHYDRIVSDSEAKLDRAEAASMYGVTTAEALTLHAELSGAQEKLIELHADSNMKSMQIITTCDEISNLTNTVQGIQQQAATFNQQRIALEAYSRQADAQSRLVKGLTGVQELRDVYQRLAVSHEKVTEMQTKLRSPALAPLPTEDRISSPPAVKSIAGKEYWQEQLSRTLPYMRSKKNG